MEQIRWLALVLLVVHFAPLPAAAQERTPEQARLTELADQLVASPRGEEGVVALEQLWSSWELVGPALIVDALEQVADDPRADRWLRAAAAWYLAEAALRLGEVEDARRASDALGVVRQYQLLGPISNEGDEGFEAIAAPEERLRDPLALEAPVAGRGGLVRWRELETPDALGVLRVEGFLQPTNQVCAYAVSQLERAESVEATVSIGGSGAIVLWINGEEVVRDPAYRGLDADRRAFRVNFAAGTNRIMAKICGDDEAPTLLLRVVDSEGRPLGDAMRADRESSSQPVASNRRSPERLQTPFEHWIRRTDDARLGRAQLLRAARFLALTEGDDPAEPVVPRMAAAGAGDPDAELVNVGDQLLAAELATDRNAARARLLALQRRFPRNAQVLIALAKVLLAGPAPQEALPHVTAALDVAPRSTAAILARAELYRRMGLALSGLRVLEGAIDDAAETPPALLRSGVQLATGARRPDLARRLGERLLTTRFDDVAMHMRVAELGRDQRDFEAAATQVEQIVHVGWHSMDERINAAQILAQLGRNQEAERALRQLVSQAPRSAEAHASLGRLLIGEGRRELAIAPLQRSLELQPQDQETRDLIAHLLDQSSFEDPFIEEPEQFLSRRRRATSGTDHALYLLDSTVVKVHDSGLSSRFHQFAVQILDQEGATDFRTHGITFVPDEQQVTVRRARVIHEDGTIEEASGRFIHYLSEPSIRMYYDERAEVIELPRLRPGDVVEIAYRVDDVAAENMMGDYFGDVVLLQGFEPRRRVSYVLIAPQEREIRFEESNLPGLQRRRHCGDDEGDGGDEEAEQCVIRWDASDVPAIRREEHQPPLAELAARVVLSTYSSWDDVGRWYWGLVRDQLIPDEGLRATVRELVDGVEDRSARVRAIHGWVVEHTRYVALEFGIHGYLPYRVTQVVDRGFGDCKDKASLLVAMLRLAGIDASLVLLRTRMSGRVPPRPPGLSLFDHAIAYVPELDLFLDGTAEQSGTQELPWMDQGVAALIVNGDGSARLVTTPVDTPNRNRARREIEVTIPRGEGAPILSMRQTIHGHSAAAARFRFQAPALRRERLESALVRDWSGARLLEHEFIELDDRESPVEITARFEAPSVLREQGGQRTVELARPRDLARRWARRSERQTSLELRMPPHEETEERIIRLPRGITVDELPAPTTIESPFGRLELEARQVESEVRVRIRLVIATERVDAAGYAEFRRFCRAVDRALGRRVRLSSSSE